MPETTKSITVIKNTVKTSSRAIQLKHPSKGSKITKMKLFIFIQAETVKTYGRKKKL